MTTPTNNAVPSDDVNDLLFNAEKLDEVVSGTGQYYTDRKGVNRRTLAGIEASADAVLGDLGYLPPVAYASGISLTLSTQTVEYGGEVYAPKVSALPFTTTTWAADSAKLRLIQGVTAVDLAASGGAAKVGYMPTGTGAVATTAQSKLRESVSVFDFMTTAEISDVRNGTLALDLTAPLQAAIASGATVINWPAGKYKITGQLVGDAESQKWIGDGPGASYNAPTASEGTTIVCVGSLGADVPFIIAPRAIEGFHLDGQDKTGIGIDFGRNYYFRAFGNYRRVTVRRFETGMRMHNIFNCYFESFVVEGNVKGVTARPVYDLAVNGGDNGYFTTITWKDLYIRNNDVYGVDAYTPKGGKDWTWENVIIESNGTVGGTKQSRFENLQISLCGAYFEAAPGVPAMQLSDCTLSIDSGLFNGTGGLDFTNNANKAKLHGVGATTSTDLISGMSGNCRLIIENCDLQNDVKDSGANVEIFSTYFAIGSKNVAKNVRSIQVGSTTLGGEQPAIVKSSLSYRKTGISTTIAAGGRYEAVTNQYSFGIFNSADGASHVYATLCGGNYYDIIPYVTQGTSDNNFSVELYNRGSSQITLTNAVLNVFVIRSDYITI